MTEATPTIGTNDIVASLAVTLDMFVARPNGDVDYLEKYGAIDTLDLTVMPEAIGAGIPLFADGFAAPMRVYDTTIYDNGALRLIYDLRP